MSQQQSSSNSVIHERSLVSPLGVAWSTQHVKLRVPGLKIGQAARLTIDGKPCDFQYTGETDPRGNAEVMLPLTLAASQCVNLRFESTSDKGKNDVSRVEIPLRDSGATIGVKGREIKVSAPAIEGGAVNGPFESYAGFAMKSAIRCPAAFEGAELARINDGAIFTDYELTYRFADFRRYRIHLRCYKNEPYVEVFERFGLRMGSELVWTLNPQRVFDSILSRDSFEGESQPTIEPLGAEHPRDVLCRLQMPVLTEYFIPNNRGWFGFFDSKNESRGMLGVVGLYGAKWEKPVEGMPELFDRAGTVEWHSSLESGSRYYLLYAGPVEKEYTKERRFVFHRLHAEFNQLRLDEHLDLDGSGVFDAKTYQKPGMFGPGDYRVAARERVKKLPIFARWAAGDDLQTVAKRHQCFLSYAALLEPTKENYQAVYDSLIWRFEKWVRQFQGWRTAENDYQKNVIGFSRWLRGMMISYEMLRRDNFLTDEQVKRLNAYFVFAARRITDEGRWPHTRTTLHPDHPQSVRDFYTYGGEHKPDRTYWTNCLPNFQSDPLTALAHLSALFPDHPDAPNWRRLALDDIDGQLDAYCGKSGAWEESINYAAYTISYMIITFKVLKERLGIDYFQDERMRRFASWLVRFLGPKDKRWDMHTWPGIGNASLPTGGGQFLICYAGELEENDPLRRDLIAAYQRLEPSSGLSEHYPTVLAAMAPIPPSSEIPLQPLKSEWMDEIGVAMRHQHDTPKESLLFQKIGFTKDHYEADETSFDWYAKGTPLSMDYGTYTGDVGIGAAHNAVDIPDLDSLRRGYLGDHYFSERVDYTRCEMPVTLKLLWGRVRSFDEVDGKDGVIDRTKTPYFYIGDRNPVGPKTWKTRALLFVKPDYIAMFDRVYGDVPHRFCLHTVADNPRREGSLLRADGRFDIDLLGFVQHPKQFDMETGELIPAYNKADPKSARVAHAQRWFRLYNRTDGIYRTVLFANEKGRSDVKMEALGPSGIRVTTKDYTDLVFLHNDPIDESPADGIRFRGRVGWIRKGADGRICACVTDGDLIEAFGWRLEGRGPWRWEDGVSHVEGGPPRPLTATRVG